jgi:hypothetical protein
MVEATNTLWRRVVELRMQTPLLGQWQSVRSPGVQGSRDD